MTPLDKYLAAHSTPFPSSMDWVIKQTHIRTNYPQMLSGPVQGRFLTMLVQLTGARRILEIGTFSGYSSACLALGLGEGGHIDTLEMNDELEDVIREGWKRAGVAGLITLHIGDARDILSTMAKAPSGENTVPAPLYDMVFMDANKREYCDYYDLVMPLLRKGGLIVADDVLWDGKVFQDKVPGDRQTSGISSFNDMVASDPRVETVMLPVRDGISLIRKK